MHLKSAGHLFKGIQEFLFRNILLVSVPHFFAKGLVTDRDLCLWRKKLPIIYFEVFGEPTYTQRRGVQVKKGYSFKASKFDINDPKRDGGFFP